MQPLSSLIHDLHPPSLDALLSDTIFEQSITAIFGEARNQHGEPGEFVLYTPSNTAFLKETNGGVNIEEIKEELGMEGDVGVEYVKEVVACERGLKLRLADAVKGETGLFASFVWNAAILASEVLLSSSNRNSSDSIASSLPRITVKDKSVLELGAGTALPSLTSALLGAKFVTMTDYPSDALISNIRQNVELNIPEGLRGKIEVWGHCWGELEEKDDDKANVEMSNWVSRRKATYDVVIAADCMWMGDQHHNLARSIHHFLAAEGKVLAIAGFHTGRQKVADFFRICQEEGLKLESIVEMDVEGTLRDWKEDRGAEDPVERKRWLTVGVLGK